MQQKSREQLPPQQSVSRDHICAVFTDSGESASASCTPHPSTMVREGCTTHATPIFDGWNFELELEEGGRASGAGPAAEVTVDYLCGCLDDPSPPNTRSPSSGPPPHPEHFIEAIRTVFLVQRSGERRQGLAKRPRLPRSPLAAAADRSRTPAMERVELLDRPGAPTLRAAPRQHRMSGGESTRDLQPRARPMKAQNFPRHYQVTKFLEDVDGIARLKTW